MAATQCLQAPNCGEDRCLQLKLNIRMEKKGNLIDNFLQDVSPCHKAQIVLSVHKSAAE